MSQVCVRRSVRSAGFVLLVLLSLLPLGALAQAARSGSDAPGYSRTDIYLGYSYWRPNAADIDYHYYQPINPGATGSLSVYFNRWLGVQAEGGYHPNGPNDCAYTGEGGVVVRHIMGHFVPFAHVLGGGVKIGGPILNPCTWGYGGTGGVGLDYVMPFWNEHLAVRILQADYQYNHVDYGPLVLPGKFQGGLVKMNTLVGSAGLVFRFGEKNAAQQAQLSCDASPSKIYPGDPVTVAASTLYLDVRRPMDFTWNTTGGKLEGHGDTVLIHTEGLAPGDYEVTGTVQQGRKGLNFAKCATAFTVKPFEPPTVTCSANPSSLHVGESSTVTASGSSPQNRPLNYTFTTTSGEISAAANTATLNTGGVAPGDVSITCHVQDDLSKSANAVVMVNIAAPVVPVAPTQQSLCSIGFERDRRRPARVDNESKACLDDIALEMQRESAAHLVVLGEHGADEGTPIAAERAVNAKQYLTIEKGIDASRIEVRTGGTEAHAVENILIPNGVQYSADGTTVVDEGLVVHHGQAYGTGRGPGAYRAPRSTHRVLRTRRGRHATAATDTTQPRVDLTTPVLSEPTLPAPPQNLQ